MVGPNSIQIDVYNVDILKGMDLHHRRHRHHVRWLLLLVDGLRLASDRSFPLA